MSLIVLTTCCDAVLILTFSIRSLWAGPLPTFLLFLLSLKFFNLLPSNLLTLSWVTLVLRTMAERREELCRALDAASRAWFRTVRAVIDSHWENHPRQWLRPRMVGNDNARGHLGEEMMGGEGVGPPLRHYWTLEVSASLNVGSRDLWTPPTAEGRETDPVPPTPMDVGMQPGAPPEEENSDDPTGVATGLQDLRVIVVEDSGEEDLQASPPRTPPPRRRRLAVQRLASTDAIPLVTINASLSGTGDTMVQSITHSPDALPSSRAPSHVAFGGED